MNLLPRWSPLRMTRWDLFLDLENFERRLESFFAGRLRSRTRDLEVEHLPQAIANGSPRTGGMAISGTRYGARWMAA